MFIVVCRTSFFFFVFLPQQKNLLNIGNIKNLTRTAKTCLNVIYIFFIVKNN